MGVDEANKPVHEPPLHVERIIVRTGRIVCDVVIPEERFRTTTPGLAVFVEQTYPDLPHHACVNDVGYAFGDVIEHTSLAHLLEHVAISIQIREDSLGADSFIGTTEWLDERQGLARIEISFRDDLMALRAFNKAVGFLNNAVLTCRT